MNKVNLALVRVIGTDRTVNLLLKSPERMQPGGQNSE